MIAVAAGDEIADQFARLAVLAKADLGLVEFCEPSKLWMLVSATSK